MKVLLFLVVFVPVAFANSSNTYKVVCYLGSWANYRPGDGKFVVEDINPLLCTHLIYSFAKLSEGNKIAVYDNYLDLKENWGLGAFERFNDLRTKNPGLKTLIAIGGWNEGSTKYSRMVSEPSSRKTFVDSCVQFLGMYGFDGLDLDWEYPANRGGKPEDKKNFVSLIKELRGAFAPYGYLLTAAVSAGESTVDSAYDIPSLGKYLDFINLMAYDFHGGWDKSTGHNAPLYARPDDAEENKKLTVDYAVKLWLSRGAPAEKIILGMPLYGRSFQLQKSQNNGLGASVNGNGMAGEYTMQPGMVGYNEICKILKKDKGWNIVFDPHVQAPYAVKDKEWIAYDDTQSIAVKVQYLRKMKLGGAMIWSLETDDFRGVCHGHRYPLLSVINNGLNDEAFPFPTESVQKVSVSTGNGQNSSPTSNLPPSTRTTPTTGSTAETNPGDLLPCPYSGYFRHPQDCKMFYFCQHKNSGSRENIYYMFRCSEGTVFSQEIRVCTYPTSVPECA